MGKKSRSKKVKNTDKLMKSKAETIKLRNLTWAMGQVFTTQAMVKKMGSSGAPIWSTASGWLQYSDLPVPAVVAAAIND